MIHPQHTITLSDFVVIVMICDIVEVSHYLEHKKITNTHKKTRQATYKESMYTSKLMYSSWSRKTWSCLLNYEVYSIKSFWKTRALSSFLHIYILLETKDLIKKSYSTKKSQVKKKKKGKREKSFSFISVHRKPTLIGHICKLWLYLIQDQCLNMKFWKKTNKCCYFKERG